MSRQMKDAVRAATEALEGIALVKCPADEYLEALEEIDNWVSASIDAAKDDLKRQDKES
jgi:hypothetical protein